MTLTLTLIIGLGLSAIAIYSYRGFRTSGASSPWMFVKQEIRRTQIEIRGWKSSSVNATLTFLDDISRRRDYVILPLLAILMGVSAIRIENERDIWSMAFWMILVSLAPWAVFIDIVYRRAELKVIFESAPFKAGTALLFVMLGFVCHAMAREDMNRLFLIDGSHFPTAASAETALRMLGFFALPAAITCIGLEVAGTLAALIKSRTFWEGVKSIFFVMVLMGSAILSYNTMLRIGFSDFEPMFTASIAYQNDMLKSFNCVGSHGVPISSDDGWRVLELEPSGVHNPAYRMSTVMRYGFMLDGRSDAEIIKPIAFDYVTCTHPIFGLSKPPSTLGGLSRSTQ